MNQKVKRIWSMILCFLLVISSNSGYLHQEHVHTHSEYEIEHDAHGTFDLLSVCEDALTFVLSLIAMPVRAEYADGVECDYCGAWRYDDWKCDNGDHCGEGSGTSCYEEHHCGYCGACDDDHDLCDDCGNCLEGHCECDEKCRGCYEMGETICKDCGEKCSGCSWVCDNCERCLDCVGDELYCSYCDICFDCAEWVCYCGDGCNQCAVGCPDCREACSSCDSDILCQDCYRCFDCVDSYCSVCSLCNLCADQVCECGNGCAECVLICRDCGEKCESCFEDKICEDCGKCMECAGGEGSFCLTCIKCDVCVDRVCYCGNGCSECAEVCPECEEKCEACADDQLCTQCGVCIDCVGGESNFCAECGLCYNCVDMVCVCGGGCSNCAIICEQCGEKCEACADDQLCTQCGVCIDCVGGESNFCAECGLCYNCVDMVCVCGGGCSNCAIICEQCGEKCEACADDELCGDCGTCFECVGGEGNYCAECGICKNCVDMVCICGEGCSDCAIICEQCGEKCEACADDELCGDCGTCFECVGGEGNYCAECGICKNCVDMVCICGEGCSDCAEICPECGEKCNKCAEEELCSGCGVCIDCAGAENFCSDCRLCYNCVEAVCLCGEGCTNCTVVCPECGEKCVNCSEDEICEECGVCVDCAGAENFCSDCRLCSNCVDAVCLCGEGCTNCTVVCPECGEKCVNCSENEICEECGVCVDCAGSDNFCITCGLCSDCGIVCPCGEGCENCADLCPECEEKCSNCCDEFCTSCNICYYCAEDLYCEDCGQCSDCTQICEECGTVCANCAESVCEDCGKCSGCIDEFCPDCGICIDCAGNMCRECYYCGDCADNLCVDCGEYCSDCADSCDECGKCENCVTICPDCELCEDCCADAAKDMGCDHGICPESDAWKTHYCAEGGHCVGSSGKLEHNKDEHWTICGKGCDNRLNPELHIFGEGKVTKEATKKSDGVMTFTCTFCGFSKEEAIPKLSTGHTHEYTAVVTEPTCKKGGYTTHTCECGYSYTDMQTPAVKHKYVQKHTESAHWQECVYCHITTEKAAHKMGSWATTVKAGYTFDGEKVCKCKICDYTIKEAIPALGLPSDKLVIVIPDYDKYVPAGSTPSEDTPSSGPADEIDPGNQDLTPNGGTEEPPASGTQQSGSKSPVTKELLTKGKDNSVPALPTLPPTEDGNQFDGWVNKATGEPVKKGDKLTENIEIEPVWKDCGEGKHADADKDNHCDECGYILVKEVKPGGTTSVPDDTPADIGNEGEKPPKDHNGGVQSWMILLIACFGGVIALCGVVLAVVLRKKK